MAPVIQAVLFDKQRWNTLTARNWLAKHGHTPIKPVHTTVSLHRYRLKEPSPRYRYRTKKLNDGVSLVIGYPL